MIVNPYVHTEQEILNSSFDETTGVLGVLPLEYDPSGATRRLTTKNAAKKITVSGANTYVASATMGSSQASAVWQVKRINVTGGDTVITWCDGNDSFDNVATDLTLLSYS